MLLLLKILLSLVISYLIGSIPTAYIIGKLYKKIDIRLYGSGNVGATNAFRVLGKGPGIAVLVIDAFKGIIPTTIVADALGLEGVLYRVVLGVVAVAGHNWTVFLQFKGGKGIATSLGVLIGLTIKIAAIRPVLFFSILSWLAVFLTTGFVSLSSIVAAILLPVLMVISNQPLELVSLGIIFCVLVIIRHRPNIKKLLSGEESRVSFFSKK